MSSMTTLFTEKETAITTQANIVFKHNPQKIALHIKLRTPTADGWSSERHDLTLHMSVEQYQTLLSSLTTTFFDVLNEMPTNDRENANG